MIFAAVATRRWLPLVLVVLLAGCAEEVDERSDFARAVDLEAFGSVAVQSDGRLKSFDSYARSMMDFVTGPRRYRGQSSSFTYLDLAFRPAAYADADVIYAKNKAMRVQMAAALSTADDLHDEPGLQARLARFVEDGLISPRLLTHRAVHDLLDEWRRDLVRTAKFVNMLETAYNVMQPGVLNGSLKAVAPPGGGFETPWLTLAAVGAADDAGPVPEPLREELASAYVSLQRNWAAQDASGVNLALAALAERLPRVNPELYPATDRLAWESWYFRAKSMTWVWLLYMPAVVVLLLSLVYRWTLARRLGLALFVVAFGFHTFALGLRWYVSGRWPNSNMFEAVTTAAWFGGAVALVCEWIVRSTAWRNVFALGSAVASMVALMAAHFLPVALTPNIANKMPVLHDVWLYIHTNVIIASYCLIFMAAVSGLLYLGHRLIGGEADHVRMGGAGTLIAAGPSESGPGGVGATPGQVLDGVTMVLMELSFVMLWSGLVMGAIWADHSWGRPWGWDPKEVFALNTFLVFAVLVHVRIKTRDKGLWTAVLAVAGAGVMLFNWIVINFVITGLHSYA